jgi:hypothetical protein
MRGLMAALVLALGVLLANSMVRRWIADANVPAAKPSDGGS